CHRDCRTARGQRQPQPAGQRSPADMSGSPTAPEQGTVRPATADWAQRPERSNMVMLRLMAWLSLRLGRPAGRVLLHLIAAYFVAFAPAARRASPDYLARALGRRARLADGYR